MFFTHSFFIPYISSIKVGVQPPLYASQHLSKSVCVSFGFFEIEKWFLLSLLNATFHFLLFSSSFNTEKKGYILVFFLGGAARLNFWNSCKRPVEFNGGGFFHCS